MTCSYGRVFGVPKSRISCCSVRLIYYHRTTQSHGEIRKMFNNRRVHFDCSIHRARALTQIETEPTKRVHTKHWQIIIIASEIEEQREKEKTKQNTNNNDKQIRIFFSLFTTTANKFMN